MTSSTAIYTCYRQLHPPTGVDHAVFGSVTSPGSRDLVVGKASILELYKVHRQPASSGDHNSGKYKGSATALGLRFGASGADAIEDDASSFYLELAGTFPLAGNISALSVVPVAGGGMSSADGGGNGDNGVDAQADDRFQDILVVCFGTAQTALVAYDSGLGRLSTLSIHNFDAGM